MEGCNYKIEGENRQLLLISFCFLKRAIIIFPNNHMNAIWEQEHIKMYEEVSGDLCVDTEAGIMIPHLIDPHEKSLNDIENNVQEFIGEVHTGLMSQKALESGTLSISNLGKYFIDGFTPIIYPGEFAMLEIGVRKIIRG
jgi:pyruvate/2-oxoglutarate dehydrogenase complex dihydrolipoamide acyltransferase (E2) component